MTSRRGQNIPLTLIVAATSKELGIGKSGQLPWRLKQEMQYFARVTKRVQSTSAKLEANRCNAVIMGRKTWDSIPAKFRPLPGRLNVVLSRNAELAAQQPPSSTKLGAGDVLYATSIEQALELLGRLDSLNAGSDPPTEDAAAMSTTLGRVFVIGGSSVYDAALKLPQTKHILLTLVHKEFDCDTHFSLKLGTEAARESGWVKRSKGELEAFVGEKVAEKLEDNGVEFEYSLFERG